MIGMPSTNFNPRSREGSALRRVAQIAHDLGISTHAPVKGATAGVEGRRRRQTISTHAPVKGATGMLGFSPGFVTISTHAPVKGATR